jgi:hypothetical protein
MNVLKYIVQIDPMCGDTVADVPEALKKECMDPVGKL